MTKPLRLLLLEDRKSDAELIIHELERSGFDPTWERVDSEKEYQKSLNPALDIILADYSLPQFNALKALHCMQTAGLDIPFVIITGSVSEEVAVECMKEGATDYLLKDRLARLGPAVDLALQQKQLEREKRSTEAALLESEALNRAVLNSLSAQIAVLNREGCIIAVNEAWERFSTENGGNPRGTGVEQNYLAVCRQSAEAGESCAQEALKGIQAVLEGTQTLFSMEYPAHSAGSMRWFTLTVTPLQVHHGGAVVSHYEVTGRKQAEERLRLQSAALEALPTTVLITDRNGIIVWVNPAFTDQTGYRSVEAVGHQSRLFNASAYETTFYKNMWSTISSGEVFHSEILNRRKSGKVYTAEITVAPVRDERGEITHFVDIEQDITERKQHERELEAIVVVANALRSARTRAEMLPVIMDLLFDLLKAKTASISLYDAAADELVVSLARGPFAAASGLRLPATEGMNGMVAASRQIYLNNSLSYDPHQNHIPFDRSYAVAGVPLIAQNQLIGIIWLGRDTEISANEGRLLSATVDMAANAIYRASLYEETERRLQRLTALREIDKAITASLDLRVTLSVLVEQVLFQLSMDAADVLLLTPETQSLEFSVGSGFRNVFTRTSRPLSQTHAHEAVFNRTVVAISNLAEDNSDLMERIHNRGEDFVAYFAAPLISKGQVKGVLEMFKRAPFFPNAEWLNFLEMLAGQAAIAVDNAELFDDLQRSNISLAMAYDETIEGWSKALDLRDRETEGHTQRVTEMTLRLARAAGIREADLVHIRRGALLHDIGKMAIPDAILLKPGAHTTEEWEIIRKHPTYAYELLSPITFLHPALDIPYCHHERWDGTGYPRSLRGEQIPFAARIFSVVDVYDALISDRPYRPGWEREKILAYIKEQSGTQFDSQVVELFLQGDW